jgi:hypothetical protein
LRKKLLPTLKSSRRTGDRLAEGRENALRSLLLTVVAPPERDSPGSAAVKRGASSHPLMASAISRRNEGRNHAVIQVL